MNAKHLLLAGAALLLAVSPGALQAQDDDVDAIQRLIDRYGELEDAMDMAGQAKLMSADRVWIGQAVGRITDQAVNMKIQQAQYEQLKKTVRGIQTFTDDRDRLIKFYGGGVVAVASFYRYTTTVFPANTDPDVAEGLGLAPAVATLVLEKRGSDWKIVHTHFSDLGAPADD